MIGHGLAAVIIACTSSLVAGFLVELFCVFWTHSFTKLSAGWTGLYSMAMATCLLAGIGQSVSLAIAAPFFVLGHGAGAYFGVVVVKRKDAAASQGATVKTPQQVAESVLVDLVVANVESLARMCRIAAPQAAVILGACVLKLREEYPDASEEEPEA